MKIWGIAIVIIVILAVICSPILAMSKSDVILKYQVSNYDEFNYPLVMDKSDAGRKPPEIRFDYGPSPSSTMTDADWLNGQSGLPWLNPFPKPALPSSGFVKPTISPGSPGINKSASTGYVPEREPSYSEEEKKYIFGNFSDVGGGDWCPPMNYIKVETERPGEVLTDSRTGEPYPVITDIRGNSYLAVEGCSG